MRTHSSHPMWRGALAPAGFVAVTLVLLLITACNSTAGSSTQGSGATPTATSAATATPATCAALLPGAGPINLTSTLIYPMVFPTGAVGLAPSVTASGAGLFTVYAFSACSPNTSVSDVNAFYASHLGALQHGWITQTVFPADGGLMQTCSAQCWYDPKGSIFDFLIFDQFTAQGNGVVTYRARYAVGPDFPNCGSNFNGGPPVEQNQFFLSGYSPSLPLPPLSSTVPDDASGGEKGFEICSPGDATSVAAFMTKELAATGWTKSSTGTSTNSCTFPAECWVNGARAISWNVPGDVTAWIIAWRQPV